MPVAFPAIPSDFDARTFARTPRSGRISFETDVGLPIQRRQVTQVPEDVRISFPAWTKPQLFAFETWFRDDTFGGSEPFTLRDPIENIDYVWQFPADTTYEITPLSTELFRVSTTLLRVRPA